MIAIEGQGDHRGRGLRGAPFVLLLLVVSLSSQARALAAPRVELLTMGRSEAIYARFGHAALRVDGDGDDAVYNFGYTDFDNDRLVIDTLQGRAEFWGVRIGFERTLNEYARQDRTVYWQPLRLTRDQHAALADKLRRTVRGRASTYRYHHYYENCSTRLRDLIDEVLGGELRAQLAGRPYGKTFRELSREGFSDSLPLLLAADYLLGRRTDVPVDWWQAGFLPDLLRAALHERVRINGRALARPAEVIYERQAPLPRGDPEAGARAIAAFAGLLGLLGLLALWLARKRRRAAGLPVIAIALLLGLLAIPPWVLSFTVALRELGETELVLLLWPTDLLLARFGWRLLRGRFEAGSWLRNYVLARVAVVVAAALGHGVGLLYQRPLAWLLVAGAPFVFLVVLVRLLPRPSVSRPEPSHEPIAL